MKAKFRCYWLLIGLSVWLGSCRSEQAAFQVTASGWRGPAATPDDARSSPAATTTLTPTGSGARAHLPALRQRPPTASRQARPLTVHSRVSGLAGAAGRLRPGHAAVPHPNVAAVRSTQEEGEGRPGLLVLGIALVVAGIVTGILVGGGLGVFIGLAVGLFGYYFLMKGLLGPHAWLEVGQELFQL